MFTVLWIKLVWLPRVLAWLSQLVEAHVMRGEKTAEACEPGDARKPSCTASTQDVAHYCILKIHIHSCESELAQRVVCHGCLQRLLLDGLSKCTGTQCGNPVSFTGTTLKIFGRHIECVQTVKDASELGSCHHVGGILFCEIQLRPLKISRCNDL